MSKPDEFGGADPRGAESSSSTSGVSDEPDEGREVDAAVMDDLRMEDRVGEDNREVVVKGLDMMEGCGRSAGDLAWGRNPMMETIRETIRKMETRSSKCFCNDGEMTRLQLWTHRPEGAFEWRTQAP